jgi:hypothetical protein
MYSNRSVQAELCAITSGVHLRAVCLTLDSEAAESPQYNELMRQAKIELQWPT